ncbi:MAG: ATP-dependent helicase [Candidatus Gastranaerophilales bacterium]|nr:ATP-dependent helicase [Candidatus Gastranaerophilales bacterium]
MLLQGTINTNKTDLLAQKYNELISGGIDEKNILVILLNSYKKNEFTKQIKEVQNPQIYTLYGLCYNAFNDNWEYISSLIGSSTNETHKPNLCGLEVSQFIFKQSIKEADFSDYISKVNLLHQLFRRYSLIVQNGLSNEEVKKRSEIAGESFYLEAQKAIDDYKLKTIQYKSFDYLRQLAILPTIYKNTDYFKNIKYLLVDDADEFSYAFWQFVDALMPQLNEYVIAYDKNGSSRCGYLCAYKKGIEDFIKNYNPKIIELQDKSTFFEKAEKIHLAIKNNNKFDLFTFNYKNSTKRLDMVEEVNKQVEKILQKGIKPCDISIISPVIDDIVLQNFNFKYQILSGNEKLVENNIVKNIIIILKLINNIQLKEYELKSLLINLLKIPYRKCAEIIRFYANEKELKDFTFKEEGYEFAYRKFISTINSLKKAKNNLSSQIQIIFANIIKEFEVDINREKYEFLLKEADSFEKAFSFSDLTKEFILQIENSVISENPIDSFDLKKDSIIVSSPQKIIDFGIKTKYQLWLDISHSDWLKNDTGTIYNAWVLNRDWDKKEYTLEDDLALTRDKTARIVRKLLLLAQENISFYSSIYDNIGNENFCGLTDFIEVTETQDIKFKITPRDDQKPVLEYKKGRMGIMAVPGAGKTTIMLALIIKLINEGVKPENIFVLTYMESAAKNFKERIKSAISENSELPNISTIHGLALRIIKENGNHNKVGLDENFEICDDNTKEKILKEIFYKLKIDDEKYDNFLRCISIVKLSNYKGELFSKFKEIQEFYRFYEEYNAVLKSHNLIDYDDMLCFAVKILEKNPEILRYYQNICKYVIEDEAQDSTDIQQKLISLLNGKYNNFVRCGDINQAITSTFTNSDLESFRKFINQNNKVEMTSSQRCSKQIYELANDIIKNTTSPNAFYKIEMQGTDKNPISDKKPTYEFFENEKDEKTFLLDKTKEILKQDPKASIAILLRLNSQVNEYNEIFLNEGIKTAVRTDCLLQKNIYKITVAVLNVIQNPMSNKLILALAEEYKHNNICNITTSDIEELKRINIPFIKQNIDEITSEGLLQLFWDIDYWINNSSIETDILALNIGLYYAKTTTDKSNSYMISTLLKRLISKKQSLEDTIKQLEYAAQKPLSAYKFFEDENVLINENPISIMTMHKSKGDEFDYVFMPEFNQENYPTEQQYVKLKSGGHFVQTIKNTVENCGIKSVEEQKTEQINETLRLIYVGVTRAKRKLYITNATNYKRRKNTNKISLFEEILVEKN